MDISVTEASVQKGANARILTGTTGEAIPIGSAIAINRTNANLLYLSDANDAVNTYRQAVSGISLSKGLGANQTITYQADSTINFGSAILEPGMVYISSNTQGKICPITDMAVFLVITTQITSNVATFTTAIPHPFVTGQVVTVASAGSIYNGTLTILAATPGTTTFTVTITHANDGPNTVTGTAQVKGIAVNLVGVAQADGQTLQLLINGANGNTGQFR